jgi:hypothetical protein
MTSKRHHNKTSELARKRGTTLIGPLRAHYGPRFAECIAESELSPMRCTNSDEPSITTLVRDFETGQ